MRIIAGEFRSRRIRAVPGSEVRPTSDRLRETLFAVLGPVIPGSIFVDAYAGSGAVGIEALSRGASRVYFLERSPGALKVLEANIAGVGAGERCRVLAGPVDRGIRSLAAGGIEPGVVFLDPPYQQLTEYEATLKLIAQLPFGTPQTLIIAEHAKRTRLPDLCLRSIRLLQQGDSALSFYRLQ